MKTLYMADLDGTLLNRESKLSKYTLTTLNALIERGLPFTVNTSRTPESATPVISGLRLKLPAVLMNGSCFYEFGTGKLTNLEAVDKLSAINTVKAALQYGCEPFLFDFDGSDTSVQYVNGKNADSLRFIEERKTYYSSFTETANPIYSKPITYIVCVGEFSALQSLAEKLRQNRKISCSVFVSENKSYTFLEVYSVKAGKWNAADRYKNMYGFDKIVTFGDNLNDIDMLKNADIGVAVADGYPEAKSAANLIIGNSYDNAVADYLLLEWSRQPDLY